MGDNNLPPKRRRNYRARPRRFVDALGRLRDFDGKHTSPGHFCIESDVSPNYSAPTLDLDDDQNWLTGEQIWEFDADAQEVVLRHPSGMTLEEVGQFFGVTRERIRQIEEIAMRKLKKRHAGLFDRFFDREENKSSARCIRRQKLEIVASNKRRHLRRVRRVRRPAVHRSPFKDSTD